MSSAGSRPARVSVLDLLELLERDRLVRVSPRIALQVEALVAQQTDWPPDALANALAALCATGPESLRELRARLGDLLGVESSEQSAASEAGERTEPAADRDAAHAGDRTTRDRPDADPGSPPRADVRQADSEPDPTQPRRAPGRVGVVRAGVDAIGGAVRAVTGAAVASARRIGRAAGRVRGGVWAAAGAVVIVAAVGAALLAPRMLREPDPQPSQPIATPPVSVTEQPTDTVKTQKPEPPPQEPYLAKNKPEETRQHTERASRPVAPSFAAALAVASLLLAAFGLAWLALPRAARAFVEALRRQGRDRRRAALRRDRDSGVPYHVDRAPPFSPGVARGAADDAATILSRARADGIGAVLDVDATLDRTCRDAGRIAPVYANVRQPDTMLVLVDVERGSHAFADGVDWILARWRQTGLRFERYDFKFSPERVWPAADPGANPSTAHPAARGRPLALSALARKRAGVPLLVLSRLAHPGPATRRPRWLRAMPAWPDRAVIDLDPRPVHERPTELPAALAALARAGVERFPFTPAGLVAAARRVVGGHPPTPPPPALPGIDDPDIESHLDLWATCAAYVPDPTWAQLEAIRQHIPELSGPLPEPWYVQRLIDLVGGWIEAAREQGTHRGPGDPEGEDGRRLAIPVAVQDELLAAQARLRGPDGAPLPGSLEWRARELLMAQLRRAAPESKLGRARRDLKLAVHQAVLDPTGVRDLEKFFGTEVDQELREILRQELAIQQAAPAGWPSAVRESIAALVADAGAGAGRRRMSARRARGRVTPRRLLRPWAREAAEADDASRRWPPRVVWTVAGSLVAALAASWLLATRSDSEERQRVDRLPERRRVVDPRPAGDLLARADDGPNSANADENDSAADERPDDHRDDDAAATPPAGPATPVARADSPRADDSPIIVVVPDVEAAPIPAAGTGLGPVAAPIKPALEGVDIAPPSSAQALRPDLVKIRGGTFWMGSKDGEGNGDEHPRRRVRITGFEMCRTEVTQGQYEAVTGKKPSYCGVGCGGDLPVQNVSWFDAIDYLIALSRREGLSPCYRRQGETVTWLSGCNGYRLPTEAEWEYAARAGKGTAYSFGNDVSQLGKYAWYSENAGGQVHKVGELGANGFGLRDMHGNVWEWVWDWMGPYPEGTGVRDNPAGVPESQAEYHDGSKWASAKMRVLRGGSFVSPAVFLRSAVRVGDWNGPGFSVWSFGFRCARGGAPSIDP